MLLRSGIVIAFFTMLSRLFGLARELFIAATFGTSGIADSVNVAFKLPNLFRRIFGEGALSAVFIPMFNEKLITSKDEALKFSGEVFALLLLILTVLTIILQISMPYMMLIIAPGFFNDPEKYELTTTLCQITIPYLIFVSITALFGGMLNSVKKFAAFAFVPIIMSICVIGITYVFQEKHSPHFSVAYALVIAGIFQVAFMYVCLKRAGLTFPFLFHPKDREVKKLLKNMGPATLGSGAQQLNLFLSQSIASFLPGAVSILSYAERLYQLPLSLIGITFGTLLLPELSRIYKQKDFAKANTLQNNSIKIALAISIPAMFGLFVLSAPIIHIIYEHGAFTPADTALTANALAAFSLGLPAFVVAKIITPIFYANLDTKTPLRITVYSLLLNTILNVILMIPFGHIGIAIGSSIASWFNVWMLARHSGKYGGFKIHPDIKLFSAKIVLSSSCMLASIVTFNYYYGYLFYSKSFLIKASALTGVVVLGVFVFVLSSYFLKIHTKLLER
ncbi:MAG: murein biosynthesis integral membrane protein MurJ [Rickettsiales bacterium]|nr:MAG: murein biosynthesis integral membrane protein MurJ [Rickettsiales bacterium]